MAHSRANKEFLNIPSQGGQVLVRITKCQLRHGSNILMAARCLQQAPGSSNHRVANVTLGGYGRVGVGPYKDTSKEGGRVGSRVRGEHE